LAYLSQHKQVAPAELGLKLRRLDELLKILGVEDHSSRRQFIARHHEKFGKTEELVGSAIFLASDASAFVTGEILVVDGGFLASGVNQ